jgi:putative DNA primase/helicase
MNKDKKPFHEKVAERLIEQLQAGTAPWQKPWQAGEPGAFMPMNPVTGNRYKGINAIHLMSQGFADVRWMTYKQAATADAQVRKGEKGTAIQYWKFSEEQTAVDGDGKPILDAKGESAKHSVQLERPRVFFATVFNAEQIDGLPAATARTDKQWNPLDRAERIIELSGASIRHGEQNRAFYRLSTDSIHLPNKDQFPTADAYYATALHELGHWTGHASRLARDLAHPFGSEAYAKEELRAEIASMILGDELGICHDPEQHAAYVGSWIKALEDDPLEIFRAAADAEEIQSYVLGMAIVREEALTTKQEANVISSAGNHADELQSMLAQIDSRATANEFEEAVKRALLNEQRVRSDSGSSNEDISAAKEVRKNAEFALAFNDADLQRRIAVERDRLAAVPANSGAGSDDPITPEPAKVFLDVPYKQKEVVKALGAKWDRGAQSWFIPAGVDPGPLVPWTKVAPLAGHGSSKNVDAVGSVGSQESDDRRVFLAVPYRQRALAKSAGAKWDKTAKSWYASNTADMTILARWKSETVLVQQSPAMSPREEFAEALRSVGCVVSGGHPMMDGETHRISVVGEKHSEKAGSGFYVGHLDGHPAGYIRNNKTGDEMKWKAKGYSLDPEQKAQMVAEAANKMLARDAEHKRLQQRTAERLEKQLSQLRSIEAPTPYMVAKGIDVHAGALTDSEGRKTYLPATDVNGKLWSMQYIIDDGTKRFAKHSRVDGCFHVVGGNDRLKDAPALVIGEGYATAASLAQSLGFATIAAFNSGNLVHVATALQAKFPDKAVIIAGDDDGHLEATQGVNPGRAKAQDAASAVGGTVLLPIFAPGEMLARPKDFTDFNDLANKSVLGIEGLNRQVRPIVNAVIERHKNQVEQLGPVVTSRADHRRATKIS